MYKIIKFILWVVMIVVWGFLIAIGFWLGHKVTDRLDQAIENKKDCLDVTETGAGV